MSSHCSHDPVGAVAKQSLFSSLSRAECRALVERSVCRSVRRGETIFREGEQCRGLYLIMEGRIRTYRANGAGHEQVLGVFGPGESLGEVSLFDEGPYLASCRVLESGRVLFLPVAEVQALYHTHPQVAHAVVRELSERVRLLAALVDRLALQDVPTRVAATVLEYARGSGALGGGASFRVPGTQEELAAELGTTREGVSRALRSLRDAGIIGQRGRRMQVLDPGRLERVAGRSSPARHARPAQTRGRIGDTARGSSDVLLRIS